MAVVVRLVAFAILAGGCVGGQTGEITMMGDCEDVAPAGEVADLDPATQARLELAATPYEGALEWGSSAPPTTITVIATPTGGPVERVGMGGCERLRVPVDLILTTSDGRLDVMLPGALELVSEDIAIVQGRASLAALDGVFDLTWLDTAPDAVLSATVDRTETSSTGQLFVKPNEREDEIRIASW